MVTIQKRLVIDASVVVKWFVPETHAKEARQLLKHHNLLAPDLLFLEVLNVLWQRVKNNLLTQKEATGMIATLLKAPLTIIPSTNLTFSAFELAIQHNQTMYDCTYVALAIREKAPLVTADAKLYRALAAKGLAHHTILLSDINSEKVGEK